MAKEIPENTWVEMRIGFKIPKNCRHRFVFRDKGHRFRSEIIAYRGAVLWRYRGSPRNQKVEKFSLDWTEQVLWFIQNNLAKTK
ncbi:MAG: hypothetical protein ACOYD4_04115 [Solirubrobacterales bacterium]